ncbi:hypothetical protein HSX10_07410 [Winogradskyella undariae]|uniref:hypothetical protein n=1 Tax=Winogradskyella undariae TaxID=1285465 RepID=UPI00156ADB31|nr:hypothetical protein [Winogradskyella undariae]NRR91388.1 hypothetical protein [Winogradskyella undariae]
MKLFNYHYDFIKFKLYNVNSSLINWDVLKPHKTLNNHYSLVSNGRFFDKNFDLFIDGGQNITIRSSIPYLIYGHNFKAFDALDLLKAMKSLSDILGIDLTEAKLIELEFGAYQKIENSSKDYINSLIGLQDYRLEKSTSSMKMFGNTKGLHLKIYDPIINAKRKKTFSLSQYPNECLIKYEIKDLKPTHLKVEDLCLPKTFISFNKKLNTHLDHLLIRSDDRYLPIDASINHILFATLKNVEQELGVPIYAKTVDLLEKMELSPSQKK